MTSQHRRTHWNRMEGMAGRCQEYVYCDKGYRSKKLHENLQYKVFITGAKLRAAADQNKRFKRRNEIELVICS